jgi:hypothetical protein
VGVGSERKDGPEEWVFYDPPKSVAFGHQSKPRDARRAWPVIERFLSEFTQSSLGPRIELSCQSPNVARDNLYNVPRADEARRLFGPETSDPRYFPSWKIEASQLEQALQFAFDDDKFPKQKEGPTRLYFSYSFSWIEFHQHIRDMQEHDARSPISSLGIYIGGRGVFLQPWFVFPAPWTSDELKHFIARIEPLTPFRFRDQYFKRVLPIKGKGKYWGKTLKLDKDWRGIV